MGSFLTYTILGLVVGCLYALSASGLVVTYMTSGVFNFAHGAIGMVAAFSYWQLTVGWHWPTIPALIVVLLVGAPLLGVVIERALIRPLQGASLEVNLVVTVGLMVLLIGVANLFWNPAKTTRTLPQFFPGHQVKVFLVYITYHQLIVVAASVAIAFGLRYFFSRTRIGTAMRAVVDNRDLTEMTGARPVRIGQVSWALGVGLASLAGVLLAPLQQLNILLLTLVIINAFTAAMIGRLKSLTGTSIGGLFLGLAVTYAVGYLPIGGFLSSIQTAIPMAVLFVVLIVLRQERLRTSTVSTLRVPPVPTLRASLGWGGAFLVVALIASQLLSSSNIATGSRLLVLAVILLSLVLLTGYGGQVSLCQMSFAGAGAYAMGHLGHGGSPLGIVAAVVLAAAFGAAVSLPTLRLRGLYLALATLAFAQAMDYVFFGQVFGAYGGGLNVSRVHLPGVPTAGNRSFFILLAVVFTAAGVALLAVRRGRVGRRLAALNDSPAACATLGVNISYTKLAVFTAAAAVAGLGGALYGGLQTVVTPDDFQLFTSLVLLLMLLVGGRNTVSGAFVGALFLSIFPVLQQHFPGLSNIQYLMTGLAALTIGRQPNGIGGRLAETGERLRAALGLRGSAPLPVEAAVDATVESPRVVEEEDKEVPVATAGELGLRVTDAAVSFGGIKALRQVNLEVRLGTVTGLIGPNGAGKTTLFNVICGLETPDQGRIEVMGQDATGLAPHRRARLGLARTFQRLEVFGSLSARDNILAAAEFRRSWSGDRDMDPAALADEVIDLMGLRRHADSRVDSLPTGLARLVELGRAMATRPKVLLLDEPGSGLDSSETEVLADVLRRLAAEGIGVLIVEHDVDLVMRVCDPIYVLDFGRIIASGPPRLVQADPQVQAAYLGAAAAPAEEEAAVTEEHAVLMGDPA
ncbi:MAG TPA: branched-chain amino acid ABC transporter permease/ATP-binding protein [Acidimicrobiales bacterium]|nr:branched-chain amino acid ABC transporter permease/ATP-binding protein [Acidimicrobiales bacterium]